MSFLGRKNELNALKEQFELSKSCCLVYGKRRVGKTTLILEAAKHFDGKVIYYECLKSSMSDNLERISKLIRESEDNEYLHFQNIIELFDFLKKNNRKYLVILDEYQYLKNLEAAGVVDSMLQKVADSLRNNIHVILSGSYVSVMKELMLEDNPLFGRFSLVLNIRNMGYLDSSLFCPELSVVDKTSYYCVFGGNPYANSNINFAKDMEYNIKRLVLQQTGILRNYMESVLLAELNKTNNANKILIALANGKKKYSELESFALFNQNGLLDKNLKVLLNMELIEKTFPINFPDDKKKSFYTISDNFCRFYYSFIVGNDHYIRVLGEDVFYEKYISPYIWQYITFRYEDMAREYFSYMIRGGKYTDVVDVGRFWYNNADEKHSGEFDVVLKHSDNSYSFYEVKCYKSHMTEQDCIEEERQVHVLEAKLNIKIRNIGFVSLNGFDFESDRYDLISGDALYQNL